jgi:leucyl-tRNA synthetase
MPIDWISVQEKWLRAWEDAKIFESNPNGNRAKYFITVAYPYPNSPQHIGHGRTYTLADVHARYMRMRGYNVLFPMGFHYTGTPILAMSKRIAENDRDLIETFINIYGVMPEYIEAFKEPINIARYFHREIKQGMREMGYSIDWRREFTTIDPVYKRFITWQFNKLKAKGLIVQGSHPVGWCPKDQSPVSQHDTLGDVEPEFVEYLLIKFHYNGYILPIATLRAETIFGVTNLWVNPEGDYVIADVNDEPWIVSKVCAEKLVHLNKKVRIKQELKGVELIGKSAVAPLIDRSVPILPAEFVDTSNGTGIVMSVPAHAPYDYQALDDLKNGIAMQEFIDKCNLHALIQGIKPIVIIRSEYYNSNTNSIPAYEVIRKYNIASQRDSRLKEATEELYSHEFYKGVMLDNTLLYANLSVKDARDKVKQDLIIKHMADTMIELANKVRCRCGSECMVKILTDQWFINYSDKAWKDLAYRCLDSMSIMPEDIRQEFKYVISWLKERACARRSGLGTNLPWDKDWIIESLSDSVIYMAYYIIARYVNSSLINEENVNDEFFDYVFLGVGSSNDVASKCKIDKELLESIRQEFLYYYPLDSRHSGRDLVPNHLTFFIFNHVALFPEQLWPKQIVVNGSVLMDGKKMSKSLGNIVPLRKAIAEHGSDAIRASLLISAELLQDADFTLDMLKSIKERVERIYNACVQFSNLSIDTIGSNNNTNSMQQEDLWLLSRLNYVIKDVTDAMDKLRVRDALNNILYIMEQDVQWYLKRARSKNRSDEDIAMVMRSFLDARVRMLAPFMPFISEEMWSILHKNRGGFVSIAEWPKADDSMINLIAYEGESLIRNTLDDIMNIVKVTKRKPEKVIIYTAEEWKWSTYLNILGLVTKGITNYTDIIRSILKDEHYTNRIKENMGMVKKMIDSILSDTPASRIRKLSIGMLDEVSILKDAKGLLEQELHASILVSKEDEYSKKKGALPYKPAIYLE